jgi:predicted ABC-type ATPase
VGKTTFAREFLPHYADCNNFVNGDLIALGMSPFSPETAALRAGRVMLDNIRTYAKRRVSFAFEKYAFRARLLSLSLETSRHYGNFTSLWGDGVLFVSLLWALC